MELNKAIEILKSHNEWRRGAEIPQTDPKVLGGAIDCVVENFDAKYESVAESYEKGFADGQEIGERVREELRKERNAYYERLQELRIEKAELIDKACEWLNNHLGKDNGTPYFIKAFRKDMEE